MAILMRRRFPRDALKFRCKAPPRLECSRRPPLQKFVSSPISTDPMILLFQLSQTESRRLAGPFARRQEGLQFLVLGSRDVSGFSDENRAGRRSPGPSPSHYK